MKKLLMTTLLLLLNACAPSGTKENEIFQDVTLIDGTVTFDTLKRTILVPQCLRCHSWVQDEAQVGIRVVPGSPATSPLFIQVQSGRMPQGGPALSSTQLSIVEAYIKGGSNNPPPPPPPLTATYSSLKIHLFDRSCTMCHNGESRRIPDLRNYQNVVRHSDETLSEIDIGSMPPLDRQGNPRAPIPSEEVINVLHQWVANGMPE